MLRLSAVAFACFGLWRVRAYIHCVQCLSVYYLIFTDLNVGSAVPAYTTGWEAASYTAVSFSVPDNWKAGRIWARRNCDFSSNPGPNSCLDGGCNGGLVCDSSTGTGVPPATVAEWTLSGDGNLDWYDISLVDGYNLPARITNNVGCGVPIAPSILARTSDVGPDALKGPFDSSGFPVGCRSACQANLDGNQADSANCCSGSHSTADTCPPSGVAYYSYFKNSCPNSYVYAYDESSGTALWTCDASLKADYTLTFCP
ncbi:thaumatin-like protein [Hymenopellis radicata]|nr:thaumatin-like protein [Hymenopellis radicata]